mmetsp:Transcript_33815/g.66971  ORF Transcript_33815/g.66971 Transcript_33815/m.66971 type:complete len:349 (+) Transcript_33815:452-1498(+)
MPDVHTSLPRLNATDQFCLVEVLWESSPHCNDLRSGGYPPFLHLCHHYHVQVRRGSKEAVGRQQHLDDRHDLCELLRSGEPDLRDANPQHERHQIQRLHFSVWIHSRYDELSKCVDHAVRSPSNDGVCKPAERGKLHRLRGNRRVQLPQVTRGTLRMLGVLLSGTSTERFRHQHNASAFAVSLLPRGRRTRDGDGGKFAFRGHLFTPQSIRGSVQLPQLPSLCASQSCRPVQKSTLAASRFRVELPLFHWAGCQSYCLLDCRGVVQNRRTGAVSGGSQPRAVVFPQRSEGREWVAEEGKGGGVEGLQCLDASSATPEVPPETCILTPHVPSNEHEQHRRICAPCSPPA